MDVEVRHISPGDRVLALHTSGPLLWTHCSLLLQHIKQVLLGTEHCARLWEHVATWPGICPQGAHRQAVTSMENTLTQVLTLEFQLQDHILPKSLTRVSASRIQGLYRNTHRSLTQHVFLLTSVVSSRPDIYLIHTSILAVSSLNMTHNFPPPQPWTWVYIRIPHSFIQQIFIEPLLLHMFKVCISRTQLL